MRGNYQTLIDQQRYQTVYAKTLGAIAAPTAGLHFTENILKFFKEKGINIATLTLHARWETFKYITATPQYTSGKFSIDKINKDYCSRNYFCKSA
ncbi:hypothetical protein AGMMS49532_06610 [Endomicrobiia bacterium]|nr:hypothetical protein AGMMS49532_06610 [Endomicrobiia bacterium]